MRVNEVTSAHQYLATSLSSLFRAFFLFLSHFKNRSLKKKRCKKKLEIISEDLKNTDSY